MEAETALKPRVWLARILLSLIGLIIVLALIFWFLGAIAQKKFNTHSAELRAQGAMLDFSDLKSARPPGTKFFDGPIEDSATAFLFSDSIDKSLKDAEWEEVQRLGANLFELKQDEEREARAIVQEQKELIEQVKEVSKLPPTRIEDIIQLTALDRPQGLKNVPYLECRNIGNLLVLDAYVAFTELHPDETLADYGYLLQLGRHYRDVPSLISQMLGIAVMSEIGSGNLMRRIIIDAEFSDESIIAFNQILDHAGIQESLKLGLVGELATFRLLLEGSNTRTPGLKKEKRLPWQLYHSSLLRFIRVKDEAFLTDYLLERVKNSELPYYQIKDRKMNNAKPGYFTPFSKLVVPNLMRVEIAYAYAENHLLQYKVALAVNRYKRDVGSYPDSVTVLTPKYLEAVPLNPLTGKPLALQYLSVTDKEQMQKSNPEMHGSFFSVGGPEGEKYLLIE